MKRHKYLYTMTCITTFKQITQNWMNVKSMHGNKLEKTKDFEKSTLRFRVREEEFIRNWSKLVE